MPPIEIDKILSDPLLIVAAVLLVVSPVLFLVAFVKYLRTPRRETMDLPHHEMHSPLPSSRSLQEPGESQRLAPAETEPDSPITSLEPLPMAAAPVAPEPPAPVTPPTPSTPPAPVAPRRPDAANEKTIVMPPGMAEMQSEMEIAFSQLKLLNKRVASLETELSRLRGSAASEHSGNLPPQPL